MLSALTAPLCLSLLPVACVVWQVFAASGQMIRGVNKKGKDFFKLVTNLTEPIRNMRVEDTKIWTGGARQSINPSVNQSCTRSSLPVFCVLARLLRARAEAVWPLQGVGGGWE